MKGNFSRKEIEVSKILLELPKLIDPETRVSSNNPSSSSPSSSAMVGAQSLGNVAVGSERERRKRLGSSAIGRDKGKPLPSSSSQEIQPLVLRFKISSPDSTAITMKNHCLPDQKKNRWLLLQGREKRRKQEEDDDDIQAQVPPISDRRQNSPSPSTPELGSGLGFRKDLSGNEIPDLNFPPPC